MNLEKIKSKIITVRGQQVILDCEVAELYDVQTKEVNQAVRNNPRKFPKGYVIQLKRNEFNELRSKILTANFVMTRVTPKVFTEKGLYMLATILKGERAIETTIEIIEAFAQLRELQKNIAEITKTTDEFQQKSLLQKSGEIITDIIYNDMETTETETTIELNLAVVSLKHTVKRNLKNK